jgi:hypothetical protein
VYGIDRHTIRGSTSGVARQAGTSLVQAAASVYALDDAPPWVSAPTTTGGAMNELDTRFRPTGGRFRISRSRGAASGVLLIVLGVWGALIPFVGPLFDFGYSDGGAWVWTTERGWLEVLPGAVAVLGGLLLVVSRNRATAMLGGWLAVAAGAWFVVGRAFASVLDIGEIGAPAATTPARGVALELTYFYGLGALIVFLAAVALGRLSVRSVRDVGYARRQAAIVTEPDPGTVEPRPADAMATADQPTEVIERKPRRRLGGKLFGRRRTPLAH